jgi:hypothetical protein
LKTVQFLLRRRHGVTLMQIVSHDAIAEKLNGETDVKT